uniref:Uncharacterized protein n=1 Tax=Anguilla anguilla TaxID=7936 RepID=A0A0E9V9Y3_ANGAN
MIASISYRYYYTENYFLTIPRPALSVCITGDIRRKSRQLLTQKASLNCNDVIPTRGLWFKLINFFYSTLI